MLQMPIHLPSLDAKLLHWQIVETTEQLTRRYVATKSATEPGGRLASHVARTVRGEQLAYSPVEAPTKYGLPINACPRCPAALARPRRRDNRIDSAMAHSRFWCGGRRPLPGIEVP